MISKEEFITFIKEYQKFESAVERLEEAISGKKYGCNLYESDWFQAVGIMFDTFLQSHFNEDGQDLVNWFVFEDVDHIITSETDDLFGNVKVKYNVNNIEDFWNYLMLFKKDYFKDV